MKIVYFGSSEFGIPSLEALLVSSHDVVHIFTQPTRPAGRGSNARPTPVCLWAKENEIPCTETANINAPEMISELASCRAELLVVIAFGQKISNEVIGLFDKGAINVHGSLLPDYRGAAPVNQVIIDGKTETGISIITLAERMDAGFILGQARTDISPEDNAGTLHDKLADLAPEILIECIDGIETGTAEYVAQDESKVTYAHKLKKSDGLIDFSSSAESILNKIRGMWPWPGARADFVAGATGKCYAVTLARAQVVRSDDNPGTVGVLDEELNVICGKDRLRILELKPNGKNLMSFEAFKNGRDVKPGDLFMSKEE